MKFKDYYAALGVARDADLEQIKKAYRKLARQHHPDMSKAAGAEARFKDVAEAYATLKDPEKRAAYDGLGSHPEGQEFEPPHADRSRGFDSNNFEDMDLADLLASLGRGHRQSGRAPGPMPGPDFETGLQVTLEDAHRGTTVHLTLQTSDGERTLEVTVPAGVTEGQKLRLRGKGGKGHAGGADGDIYLHITLQPHAVFRTDHHDLYFDLALTPWEAALGTDVQVATLDQPVMLTVPPLTPSGRKLRLRGRGLPNPRAGAVGVPGAAASPDSKRHGDLYAVVRIDMPTSLNAAQRKLFEEIASSSTFNPRANPAAPQPKEKSHDTPTD